MSQPNPPVAPKALVVGDIMTDVLVKPEGPINRGSDRRATIHTMWGGSGANQAIWLVHFGVPTIFAGKVNRADLARCAHHLRGYGVTPALGADDEAPSGALVSIIDPDGQRSFLTSRGANDTLDIADLPDALLDGVLLLEVSGYALVSPRSRVAALDLLARARRRGVKIAVDPASVSFLEEIGPRNFLDWTRGADLCFPNEAEAALLAGAPDAKSQRRLLSEVYIQTVIKRGAHGAESVQEGRTLLEPAPEMTSPVVDTTGAGDAFLAGFLAKLLAAGAPSECLNAGVAAGCAATTMFGAQPRNPGSRLPTGR